MKQLKVVGGLRAGMANATWPFATLKATKDKLVLKAFMIGKFSFSKEDIISIEPYYDIPIIGRGIKINHKVIQYKEKIIFWSFKNPNEIINDIMLLGFLDNT
ncbi:MAG: hypothetical protein JNL22_00335 [Bacteroidales bacterium]|nr:hypothetical protein [Bacteroidales bacterium]